MGQTLFEVSWEVANKVGGIHTVISTKARTLTASHGDDYIAIGPWVLSHQDGAQPFDEEPGFEHFTQSCREMGVPVTVGRWRIPGSPRCILVEFSGLYEQRDRILEKLWENYRVDSLFGGWEYVEPVIFGHACGLVIERYWQEFIAPYRGTAVAQFHEWMTGAGMLYLKDQAPEVGTVFTTHATILGRSVSSAGQSPEEGLMGQTPELLAESFGIRSKHSLEGTCARESDVFTTVSEITAREAELFHYRKPDPLLPNGIDVSVIDELAGETSRQEARDRILSIASRFFGEDLSDAYSTVISGRYEFHNKGIDVFLDAMAELDQKEGRKILGLVLVPAGHSGLRTEVLERQNMPLEELTGSLGISTHNLFDEENDPVQNYCKKLGLTNEPGSRVKVLQIPIYLNGKDGLVDLPYEAVLRGLDLSCFPSFYEPWGYTPEESLAVGVPTITSDYAGFGRWCKAEQLGHEAGVDVVERLGVPYEDLGSLVADRIEARLKEWEAGTDLYETCRQTAGRTAWSDLVAHYETAFAKAGEQAGSRDSTHTKDYVPQLSLPVRPKKESRRPRLFQFDVSASLPEALQGIERLTRNFWWCWDTEAKQLFEEISEGSWETCGHNPVTLLQEVSPDDLDAKAADPDFVAKVQRILARFDAYMDAAPAAADDGDPRRSVDHPVAYFCAEFGVHESLKIYSGGLGLLAGDHLKSASDLGLPLIGVGLFYPKGYMRQKLTVHGDQISLDQVNDPRKLPLSEVCDADGRPVTLDIRLPGSVVKLKAWKAMVGRVPLYLLDCDIEGNREEDRRICEHLYGGDSERRLRQEILLGKGGTRLLRALGIEPSAWHMNEGHPAFLALERVSVLLRQSGLRFDEAREFVRATTTFTTHTPVPAGHDRFGEELIRRYFADVEHSAGIPWERFYALGLADQDTSAFNMSYFALNFASIVNGVSRLHGDVSKSLFEPFWPELLPSEIPVGHVTNGVHLPTWVSPELSQLYGAAERLPEREDFASKTKDLDVEQLWVVKQNAKKRLLEKLEKRIEQSFYERNDSPSILQRMVAGLDHRALVIGFARRFAPYKRAHLLFQDTERLAELLNHPERPLRIFFAGKAHPNDHHGQEILKRVVELSRREPFLGKVLFLENYDIDLARHLVQGVDVWLNTPTRPLEASGTSGMKVACNGGLNLSILDGWWCEGYDGSNGWAIGEGRLFASQELQDEMDGSTLYRLLEEELLPLFHERDVHGVPRAWMERILRSLETIPPFFSTDRMVQEYDEKAYGPLSKNHFALGSGACERVRDQSAALRSLRGGFDTLQIRGVSIADASKLQVGDTVQVQIEVELGQLDAKDVVAELVLGPASDLSKPEQVQVVELHPVRRAEGPQVFEGSYEMQRSGSFSYGVRVRARAEAPFDASVRDLVVWA